MSILKTHNTRRTLEAMAERHRKDARTLAMLCAEAIMEPTNEEAGCALYKIQVCIFDLKKMTAQLESIAAPAAPEGAE